MSDYLPIVTILRDMEIGEKSNRVIKTRDLRPKNIELLKESINSVNWDDYLNGCNVVPQNDKNASVIPQNVLVNLMFDKCHSKL